MLLPLLMNLGMLGRIPDGSGSWEGFSKRKKKRKANVIRRSDFDSVEAYQASLRALFPVEPKTRFIEPVSPLAESDGEDEIILAVVSRLLH